MDGPDAEKLHAVIHGEPIVLAVPIMEAIAAVNLIRTAAPIACCVCCRDLALEHVAALIAQMPAELRALYAIGLPESPACDPPAECPECDQAAADPPVVAAVVIRPAIRVRTLWQVHELLLSTPAN